MDEVGAATGASGSGPASVSVSADDPGPRDWLSWVRSVAGLAAAVVGVVYVTGGLVLELQLKFLRVPSFEVLSELPRDFLISVGMTQVVVPAVLSAAVIGVLELTVAKHLEDTHYAWPGRRTHSFRAYLAFYAGAPVVLLAPGAIDAVKQNAPVAHRTAVAVAILALCVIAVTVFVAYLWPLRHDEAPATGPTGNPLSWPWLIATAGLGVLTWVGVAVWVLLDSTSEREGYFAFAVGAVPTTLIAMLVVWIRGQIGTHARNGAMRPTMFVVFSWAATALLLVPGFVAYGAVQLLPTAEACVRDGGGHASVAGRLIGETSARVYLGEKTKQQVVAVPEAEVIRLYLGKNVSAGDPACTGP